MFDFFSCSLSHSTCLTFFLFHPLLFFNSISIPDSLLMPRILPFFSHSIFPAFPALINPSYSTNMASSPTFLLFFFVDFALIQAIPLYFPSFPIFTHPVLFRISYHPSFHSFLTAYFTSSSILTHSMLEPIPCLHSFHTAPCSILSLNSHFNSFFIFLHSILSLIPYSHSFHACTCSVPQLIPYFCLFHILPPRAFPHFILQHVPNFPHSIF